MLRRLVVSAILSAIVVSGCGESDPSPSTGLTKDELVSKGNAICRRGGEEIKARSQELKSKLGLGARGTLGRQQEEAFVIAVVVPAVRKEAEQLANLVPPDGDEGEVNEIVAGLGRMASVGAESPASLLVSSGPIGEVNAAAKKYGILECMQP